MITIRAAEHQNTVPPAEARGDEQRQRPGQHDAGQQARHHIADDAAPALGGYQMGEQGYEHLGAGRAHPDDEGGQEEWRADVAVAMPTSPSAVMGPWSGRRLRFSTRSASETSRNRPKP